ncbi:nitroreductase family protein [uncultured Cellulomonas sp.]|uniref:nitroreductase family protein n=1 Tax=uncultured Cellulomonas sp. TaxID=189682 RepID=UPI00261F0E57|nr:nitroreductase family protein [uncultured Cellulomonas sp.]
MVRRYSPDPVDPAVVDRLLRYAQRAPSAGFSQGWAFLVLDTPADVARFWTATTPPERAAAPGRWLRGMTTAPVVVVPMSSEAAYRRRYAERDKAAAGERGGVPGAAEGRADLPWSVPYWHVDAGMASLLVLLGAVDEGLGACFFGIPADRVAHLRREFAVPADLAPVGALTIGHRHPTETAGGSATRRPRRPADEVVHRGGWHPVERSGALQPDHGEQHGEQEGEQHGG